MPIHSYAIESLTIHLNPRMKRILQLYNKGIEINRSDIEYLINNTVRWNTFSAEVYKKRSIEIPISKGSFGSDTIELGEIIHEIVKETGNLNATSLEKEGKIYRLDTEYLSDTNESILTLAMDDNIKRVAKAFRDSQRYVKDLQNDFDKQKIDTTVEGHLGSISNKYPVKFYFRADTDIEEVIKDYTKYKQTAILNDLAKYKKELNILTKALENN